MYGSVIKTLRKAEHMSQDELAHKLGFRSASTIGMIEREEREPSIETIIRLTQIFNVSADYILGLTTKEEKNE